MLFDDTAHSFSCPFLLSFLFNVNIIPATLSSSELAVVVPGWGWVIVQAVGGKFRYKVLSKHCTLCKIWSTRRHKGTISTAGHEEWWVKHAPECQINTSVSSPSMKTEAIKATWSRSLDKNKLRYTTYIGDGDSKGHASVRE